MVSTDESGSGKVSLCVSAKRISALCLNVRVLPGQDYHIKHQLIPGEDVIPESEMRLPPEENPRYRDRRDYDRNEELRSKRIDYDR